MLRNSHFYLVLSTLLILGLSDPAMAASYIWWEGEDTKATNFPDNTWFGNGAIQGKEHLLSGGAWLCNEGDRTGDEAFARYDVTVPEAGEYDFWVRKFWKHGPFRWRFGNEMDWREVGRDISLADNVDIATHLGANWVYAGQVALEEGQTTFELRLLAEVGESETACFDAFLLTQQPFVPRGKLKPDEKSDMSDEGFFPWEPGLDEFTDDALLDLSYLNEDEAGQNGFVRTSGGDFVLGNGETVRFWGVNASSGVAGQNRGSIDSMAKMLAKRGVNMVRYHSPLFDGSDVDQLDQKKLDDLHYLIAALKREGIYTKVSFYFPLWFDIQPQYGIDGYDEIDNKRPFALLYFEERMQEIYNSWAEELLTTENPYTGTAIAKDPAVAIVEIINEDSFFFWTFTENNVPQQHWQALEARFAQWVLDEYGSYDDAFDAWGGRRNGDEPNEDRIDLMNAWDMTGDSVRQANTGRKQRIGDQVQFLTELQRGFYQNTVNYFKDELGYEGLVSCSNWHVTDPAMLGALERYTYTAGDVIDKHGYFGGDHDSPDGRHSYAVDTGHTFSNLSALTTPGSLPLQFIQIEGYPHIISEVGWTNPNLYRADYAFMASAYGSLQGVDGFYTFALGGTGWDVSMEKFAASSPVILGNFPAYALMYRRGDVQEAEPVIYQSLKLKNLFDMEGNGGGESQALDELREADVPPGEALTGDVESIDPLAYYTGKILRDFDTDEESFQLNLSKFIDRDENTVTSLTEELSLDYGSGLLTLNSSKAQGAAGFLNEAGMIDLGDVMIDSNNEYASVIVIALDDKPVKESSRLLIQCMTAERPYGFETSGDEQGTITNLGGYPFGIKNIDTQITLKGNGWNEAQVTALDENGYPRDVEIKAQSNDDGSMSIQLADDSVYHIVTRNPQTKVSHWSAK